MSEEKKLAGLDAEGVYNVMKRHNQELVWQLERWMEFGQHIVDIAFHQKEFDINNLAAHATDRIEDTEEIIN